MSLLSAGRDLITLGTVDSDQALQTRQRTMSINTWAAAVFARNEARRIGTCLDSLLQAHHATPGRVTVLVNGSTDSTATIVRSIATVHPCIDTVELEQGDKAASWNHYVHERRIAADMHLFIDGDVCAQTGFVPAISHAFAQHPDAVAVAAIPASGRDRAGWSQRMREHGRLAGGLYALRGDWLDGLRREDLHLPHGLIGEDLFLSCVAKSMLHPGGIYQPSPRLALTDRATFAFESLSVARPQDWWTYLKRLVRYRLRDHQLALLLQRLSEEPHRGMPYDMATLYREAPALPDYYWRGLQTPFDMIAVHHMRRVARQAAR